MIDIHSHILPGLDDGSMNLDESLDMAEIAASGGTTAMACTVHSNQMGRFENFESPELKAAFRQLTDAVKKEKIPLTLVRGMEIFAFSPEDLVEKIRTKQLISLNGSGNYLVEFAFPEDPVRIRSCLQEMILAGKQPVLAHPERYYCVQEDPNYLFDWVQMGVIAQMNKGSLFGRFGRQEEKTAQIILDHHMIRCIASDAHGADYRTPDLMEIQQFLDRNYSEELRKRLLQVNPSRILMKKELPPVLAPPIPVERPRRVFV